MRIVLEVEDSKAEHFLSFIKENITSITKFEKSKSRRKNAKEGKLVRDVKEALRDVRLHQEGKLKLKTLQQVLDEL